MLFNERQDVCVSKNCPKLCWDRKLASGPAQAHNMAIVPKGMHFYVNVPAMHFAVL